MPELQGFLKGHVHLWGSGNRVWHRLSLSMTVKEEQAAGTFFLLIPPDWGVRTPEKSCVVLGCDANAARMEYRLYFSVGCQPSEPSEYLSVDNERTALPQKWEAERKAVGGHVCVSTRVYVCLCRCGLRAGSCYGVATRTCLQYTRQRFASKVIVHAVLLSSPPSFPPMRHTHTHTHTHAFLILILLCREGRRQK